MLVCEAREINEFVVDGNALVRVPALTLVSRVIVL
jgi:hypothetical protein